MRLLASDIDGTLVPRLGPVSDRTVAALRAAQDAGVHVVLATGRPPRWMTEIAARTGVRGHAVLANGAVVVDLQRVGDPDHGVVSTTTIAPEDVLRITEDLRAELPDVCLRGGVGQRLRRRARAGRRRSRPGCPRAPLAELLERTGGVVKLLAKLPGGDPFAPGATPDGPAAHASASTAGRRPARAGPAGGRRPRRAHALRGRGAHGRDRPPGGRPRPPPWPGSRPSWAWTPRDAVAFGDMPNDVAMLRWAGAGYAMADGHPDAVAAADRVAPPCAEDGVAQVVEELLAGLAARAERRPA